MRLSETEPNARMDFCSNVGWLHLQTKTPMGLAVCEAASEMWLDAYWEREAGRAALREAQHDD